MTDAEEGYVAAEIKATKGEEVTVVTSKGNEVNFFFNNYNNYNFLIITIITNIFLVNFEKGTCSRNESPKI